MRVWKIVTGVAMGAVTPASCSSSPSSSPARIPVSPAYDRPGPFEVGVTTTDRAPAGPVLGERMATACYPADTPGSPGIP